MSTRRLTIVGGLVSLVLSTASVAHAGPVPTQAPGDPSPVPQLQWAACGATPEAVAAAVECARATLPLDYDEPEGAQVEIAVGRVPAAVPAQRIGSLFFNFGGPGAPAVDYLQAAGSGLFERLNQRFDIVAFDPRGVGQSTPAVNCQAPPEPGPPELPTPLDADLDALLAEAQTYVDACVAANGELLEHLSTANVARDMDALRAGLGEEQLNFLGFSYGTLVGATYATLFPGRYRSLVLDGALDPELYLNDPATEPSTASRPSRTLWTGSSTPAPPTRSACSGFGGADPLAAYDALLAGAEATPIPVLNVPANPAPVTADEIRIVTFQLLYAKQAWGFLALALAEAAQGDGSIFRQLMILLDGGRSRVRRPLLRDHGRRAAVAHRHRLLPGARGGGVGRCTRTSGSSAATTTSSTRCGRRTTRTPSGAPSTPTRPPRPSSSSAPRTTRRRRTPGRSR